MFQHKMQMVVAVLFQTHQKYLQRNIKDMKNENSLIKIN